MVVCVMFSDADAADDQTRLMMMSIMMIMMMMINQVTLYSSMATF